MEKSLVLSPVVTIVWVLVGIVISLVLPVAVRTLRSTSLESGGQRATLWQRIAGAWQKYGGNKYLGITLAATFVAIVLVLLLGLEFSKSRDAMLAGFAWESLINKLLGGRG